MYLDAHTIEVLREHLKRQREERVALGPAWDPESDLVFRHELGGMIHPDWFSRHFESVVRSLEVPRIRLHDYADVGISMIYVTLTQHSPYDSALTQCCSVNDSATPRSPSPLISTLTSSRASIETQPTSLRNSFYRRAADVAKGPEGRLTRMGRELSQTVADHRPANPFAPSVWTLLDAISNSGALRR